MGQWLVTANDAQFSVDGLPELKQMAVTGKLKAGDMIQPPGATDWVYASEVSELKAVLARRMDDGTDESTGPKRSVVPILVGAMLVVVLLLAGAAAATLATMLPTGNETLIGDGGLTYSQMLTTEAAALVAEPKSNSKTLSTLKKDQTLDLLAKRGDFYKARTQGGAEGWVSTSSVIPMYQLGGVAARDEFDPLYNPDQYVDVANARWSQLPDQVKDQITVFQLALENRSPYDMTNIVILATIKDDAGAEIEKVEIPVEGVVPARETTMIGTLHGEAKEDPIRLLTYRSFEVEAQENPDLRLRFSDGAEVKMGTENFTEASIDILELRAIPKK